MNVRTLFLLAALVLSTCSGRAGPLLVLAAASTTDVVKQLGATFADETGHEIRYNFASSGTLARQIQSGAPADIYLSANEKWMNVLVSDGDVEKSSRINLLTNELVLIVPAGHPAELNDDFSGRLAVGDVHSVPVGMYAREALEHLGLFDQLGTHLIMGSSARATLMLVARNEVDAGIVYATDARMSDKVSVVTAFPKESHSPICYPVAVCTASKNKLVAQEFIHFLSSPEARVVFESYGFTPLMEAP